MGQVTREGAEAFRSRCPLASALDIVGDKWSLVVVRDLHFGKLQFAELERSEEGISPAVLSDRLHRLEAFDIVAREVYQHRPLRAQYVLTDKGRALVAAIIPLAAWANAYIPGRYPVPTTPRQVEIASKFKR